MSLEENTTSSMSSNTSSTSNISSISSNYPEIDEKLRKLREKKDAWTRLSFAEKSTLLQMILKNLSIAAPEWIQLASSAKKIDKSLEAEEFAGGIYPTVRLVRLLIETYKPAVEAERENKPVKFLSPPSVSDQNGQTIVRVYPTDMAESLMFPGITVDTFLLPGTKATQGKEILETKATGMGKVSLILGAGNQSSIPFMDTFYKLFNQNQVVILKHNPVCEWLFPIVEKVMKPLIDMDFFHHVKGGVEEGKYLVSQVDNVHITGSDKTHDAIVWEKIDKTNLENQPVFNKEITSELGCVSPFVIVPGKLSDSDLEYMAQHILGAVVNNNSFNCNAAKLLVVQKGWPQRDALLNLIRKTLSVTPIRYAYYPGAEQRYKSFLDRYPQAEKMSESSITKATTDQDKEKFIPWTLIPDVPTDERGNYIFSNEPFCPILSEILLEASSIPEFLEKATKFCNERVWGNLTMSIFIDPKTEARYKTELKSTINELKYGGVAINCWSGVLYGLGSPVWGAFPGNDTRNIQSGRGFVHNSFLLDYPQKSVARAPFQLVLGTKYPYFPNHANSTNFFNSLSQYESSPSVAGFIGAMWNALWG